MATPFNQGVPSVPVVLNTSNVFVFGNTASGNALSVQQLGTGNVATFRTTTGATALFVNAAGNVGVGTANPSYQLSVATGLGATATPTVQIADTVGPKSLSVIPNASSGVYNAMVATGDTLVVAGAGTTVNTGVLTLAPWSGSSVGARIGGSSNIFGIYSNATTFYSNAVSPATVMTVTNGRVGIGTNNPSANFHYFGGASSTTTNGAPGSGGVIIGSDATNGNVGDYSPVLHFRQSWYTQGQGSVSTGGIAGYKTVGSGSFGGGLAFLYCANGAASLTQGMTLTDLGRVGIGTSSPGNLLSVNNGTTDGTVCRLVGGNGATASAGPSIDFSISNLPTYSGASIKSLNSYTDGSGQSAHLAFYTANWNGSSGSLQERMRITSGGNVGIGTTTPSTRLSVEGATSTAGRNDVGMTLNVNVNDATLSTTAPNAAPFGINVLQSASGSYRFCQFNSGYTPGSGGSLDAEFIVYGNGNVTADGSYTSPADYAEMFEWEDGNPDGEDRVGYSVILSSGNKIRKSESTDSPDLLIGVISGRPAVCADTAWNRWADKYLKDDFNRYLMEEYEVWKWTDDDGKDISYDFDKIPEGVIVPENKTIIVQERYVLNPNYDPNVVYTPRMERKEWSPVGMVGKLSLLSGQLTGPRWIKLVDFSPSVSQWLIR
jgi:hypothetical protein